MNVIPDRAPESDGKFRDIEPQSFALPTDTKYRAVQYCETYTGKAFYPMNPKVEDVTILDIAHHLAAQCRYLGATQKFYSTAQHCCLLAHYAETKLKANVVDCAQILLHDAAEAYLTDLPRPIKQHFPEFRAVDYTIQQCVRKWAGLDVAPLPSWQDEIDSRIIHDERAQLMCESGNDWQHAGQPLGVHIVPWTAEHAEAQFLFRWAAYSRSMFGTFQLYREEWGIDGMAGSPMKMNVTPSHSDSATIEGIVEADIRGGVGKVKLRSPDGMLIRDPSGGKFPRPAWKWVHGRFELIEGGNGN